MREVRRRTMWGIRPWVGADFGHKGALVLVCGVMFWGIATGPVGAASPAPEADSVLALAKQAAIAVQTNLRTGSAKGTFRVWGLNNELTLSVRFNGAFDGAKDYLKLTYSPVEGEPPQRHYDKRIVVCDGSEMFVSEFSKRIHPVGARSQVFSSERGSLVLATGGFPFRIKTAAEGIFRPVILDKFKVKMEKLPGGHYRARLEAGAGGYETLEFAPEYGYHAVLGESFRDGELTCRFAATLQRLGDLWCTTSWRREGYRDGKIWKAYELKFDQFEPNVPVSSELFTLNALELPAGARIIDQRPPESVAEGVETYKPKIYRLPDTEERTVQKQADRLIEQVESLPEMYQKEQAESRWGARVWGVVFGLLGIVLIAVVWFIHQRKGTTKRKVG